MPFFILGYFLPFYLPNSPKKKKKKKTEKESLEISLFYNSVSKIVITCHTVPGIWCVTDVIIFHFGPFFAFFSPMGPENQNFQKNKKNTQKILSFYKHKWQSYDVWFLRYRVQCAKFFVILDCFLHFYPLTTPKIKILEK